MTVLGDILKAHGITNYCFVDFGDFDDLYALGDVLGSTAAAVAYYVSQGFRIWPDQDISDGVTDLVGDIESVSTSFSQFGCGLMGPLYGWGYETQYYLGLATNYPNDQEFCLPETTVNATSDSGQAVLSVASASEFAATNAVVINYGGPSQETLLVSSRTSTALILNANLQYTHDVGELVTGTLSAALGEGTTPGVVIDSPGMLPTFKQVYSQIHSGVSGGLGNYLATADWILADHPVQYGNVANFGKTGASAGHNMNTYTRFVNSEWYTSQVNSSGNHTADGTPCQIYFLVGRAPDFVSSGLSIVVGNPIVPSLLQASDVDVYHKIGQIGNITDGFRMYIAQANGELELGVWQYLNSFTPSFMRTAIPYNVIQTVPPFISAKKELLGFNYLQTTGGTTGIADWFNYCNPSDNSSNPGGGFGNATSATVLNYFLTILPFYSHLPFAEVDTDPYELQTQSTATSWGHFGGLIGNMPYLGGWYGYEQDAVRVLTVDHNYGNPQTWSALGTICHQWGTDSYSSLSGWNLSNFHVIVGIPSREQDSTYATDLALIETYVSDGGTLIVYTNSEVPSSLSGIGSTAVAISYPHPILAPYAESDLNAAFPSGYGYINDYGAGKVITLYANYYGDGFGVGDTVASDGETDSLSSGLAYLTLNAILWAAGQPTPAIYLPKYVQRTSWAAPLNESGEGGFSGVGINICGQGDGQMLVWLSNANTSTANLQVSLSSAFYNLPASWIARNTNGGSIIQGTGDLVINQILPIQDWMPLYVQSETTIQLSSDFIGLPEPIEATVSGSNSVGMRFKAPATLAGFEVEFYGLMVGSPPPLSILLYSDGGQGTSSLPSELIEVEVISTVNSTAGWQRPLSFASTLTAGTYYWIVFQCPGASSPNDYLVYVNSYIYSPDSVALTTYVPLGNTPITDVRYGPIFQLSDALGNPALVMPFHAFTGLTSTMNQSFIAPRDLSFNMVWIFTSDRAWDTNVLGISVIGPSGTLATGGLSEIYENGIGTDSWVPIQLSNTVTLERGDAYSIVETTGIVTQYIFTVETSPQSYGFQNQSTYYAFQLAQTNLLDHCFDYGSLHQSDDSTSTQFMSARWLNTSAGTLIEVDVRIFSVLSAGTLQAQLWTDNGGGINLSTPSSPVPGAIGAVSVTTTGWATITFSSPPSLKPNTYYWIVLSSPDGDLEATRLVNPHVFRILEYYPSLREWNEPAQGPTDLAIRIVTSVDEYRSMFDLLNNVSSDPSTWYAQSYTSSFTSEVVGVAVEISSGAAAGASAYSDCSVGLYSDNGGSPGTLLASGTIPQSVIGLQSLVPCQFVSAVDVVAGTRYWIVAYGNDSSGIIELYLRSQRVGYASDGYAGGSEQALVSANSGSSWSQPIAGRTAYLEFAILGAVSPPSPSSTPRVIIVE
jgi:hypothetical protein